MSHTETGYLITINCVRYPGCDAVVRVHARTQPAARRAVDATAHEAGWLKGPGVDRWTCGKCLECGEDAAGNVVWRQKVATDA